MVMQEGGCRILAQSNSCRSTDGLPYPSTAGAQFALTHAVALQRKKGRQSLPWRITMQQQQEPLLLADDGTYVDVTQFVRFELNHKDIRYGVLDLVVQFSYKGHRAQCYLLHFFPVETVKENVRQTFPEWTEGFHFPPALLKLRATLEGSITPLYHQGCIAINTRGATLYGSRRSLVRRMILHIQHHEEPLLTVLASSVPAREATEDMDPLDAFLQTRPFPGSLPRRAGFWTFNDKLQQPPLRVNTQPMEQAKCRAHAPSR